MSWLHFKTDAERKQALADAFELTGAELHANVARFYDKYLVTLDHERLEYLITLVAHAKAVAVARSRE